MKDTMLSSSGQIKTLTKPSQEQIERQHSARKPADTRLGNLSYKTRPDMKENLGNLPLVWIFKFSTYEYIQ